MLSRQKHSQPSVSANMPLPPQSLPRLPTFLLLVLAATCLPACRTSPPLGSITKRQGDEIVVAGEFVHTGARVVLWMDPGGYDAYRVERRFSPLAKSDWENSQVEAKDLSSPNRYNLRRNGLSETEIEQVRGGGWDLPTLQGVVDQLVLHFDACGTSRQCFNVLQDHRGLSVHFMIDLDGTVYQTLDVKERAWHATSSNSRSVGVEIANIGAYDANARNPLGDWYVKDTHGSTRINLPQRFGDGGIRTKKFIGHPSRPDPVYGKIQARELVQYDFTTEQYRALAHLTAALCRVLPQIRCDCPRDKSGQPLLHKLPEEELKGYQGVLGHYHIQSDKVDPGPAFRWDDLIVNARRLLHSGMSEQADETSRGHLRPRN